MCVCAGVLLFSAQTRPWEANVPGTRDDWTPEPPTKTPPASPAVAPCPLPNRQAPSTRGGSLGWAGMVPRQARTLHRLYLWNTRPSLSSELPSCFPCASQLRFLGSSAIETSAKSLISMVGARTVDPLIIGIQRDTAILSNHFCWPPKANGCGRRAVPQAATMISTPATTPTLLTEINALQIYIRNHASALSRVRLSVKDLASTSRCLSCRKSRSSGKSPIAVSDAPSITLRSPTQAFWKASRPKTWNGD